MTRFVEVEEIVEDIVSEMDEIGLRKIEFRVGDVSFLINSDIPNSEWLFAWLHDPDNLEWYFAPIIQPEERIKNKAIQALHVFLDNREEVENIVFERITQMGKRNV